MENKLKDDILLLYVEDDEATREELEYYLKKRIEKVVVASNGQEGYELFLKYNPDIIITDIQMPVMTGIEMCKLIREKNKDTTIIITSAYSDTHYLNEAVKMGINTFLLKPIDLIQLHCTLKITSDNVSLKRKNKKTKIELNETQTRLVEADKMANLGGLVAGVTHEINTPLGVGLSSSNHLFEITKKIKEEYKKDKMTQDSFEKYLDTCEELSKMTYLNLERTSELIKSFKQVAVDQTNEEKREFHLKKYIEELIFSLNYVIKKTKLKIDIICSNDIVLNSYPGSFSQIFTNFIMNSIKHAYAKEQEGLIIFHITKSDDILTILYSDDGKGVSKEKLEKIFIPFYTTKKDSGGTGLGLSIVKDIVTSKLNGSIDCVSKLGKGMTFTIKIPL